MEILLDTHTLLWFLKGDNKISDKTLDLIRNKDNFRYVSVVSLWEIVIKSSLNKLDFKKTIPDMLRLLFQNDIGLITVVPEYLNVLNDLPHHHGDPLTGCSSHKPYLKTLLSLLPTGILHLIR